MDRPIDGDSDRERGAWSRLVRERWLLGGLALSALALAVLLAPFLYVLLFAAVVVVVSWPLYERVLGGCGGRRGLAAVLTALLLALVVFVPVAFLVYRFAEQAIAIVGVGVEFVQSGALAERLAYLGTSTEWMPGWVERLLPADLDLAAAIGGPLQGWLLGALQTLANAVPALVGGTMSAGIDLALFLLAVVTLYTEGPRLLASIADLSPLEDAYDRRLFGVFTEFANNVVLGTLATAAIQGTVAGLGYAIAGVDRALFFAILTGVFSLVPVVGTVVVWVPLAIATGFEHGVGWGLFLAGWGLAITQLDNVVRPLFLRGRTDVHPLLVFLGVFGGLAWMGVPGALVGPIVVVFFLALFTIYREDFLGRPPPPARSGSRVPAWVSGLVRRARAALPAT